MLGRRRGGQQLLASALHQWCIEAECTTVAAGWLSLSSPLLFLSSSLFFLSSLSSSLLSPSLSATTSSLLYDWPCHQVCAQVWQLDNEGGDGHYLTRDKQHGRRVRARHIDAAVGEFFHNGTALRKDVLDQVRRQVEALLEVMQAVQGRCSPD